MQKSGVFMAVLAATVALTSATGCFYCASGGCEEKKEVCFWALLAPEYTCEEYTTPCGDEKCGWDKKCVSTKKCGYGRCKETLVCAGHAEPKKCEDVQVCKKSSKDKLECEQKKECKDFEPVKCGEKTCAKGFVCKKSEPKKAYVCDTVCSSNSTCSCDSGKVCKFSNRCEVKSIHPTYSVYYHPGTSGAHGDGGYYYPPAGSSHPVTGGSPSRGSPSRGSPPDASPPAAGSPPTGGASPSSPALDLPGQVDITTEATAAFDSAAAAAGDATAGPGSIFTGTSIAQAENASAASSYVGGDLGDYSVGSAVALSGAAYDSQAYSQALVYGDEGGAASSLAASYAYNQGLALADSVSGGYDGGSGLAQSLSAATDGGVASSQAIGLGGYGGIGAAYADARAYDQGDVTATADATSFTPGLKTTADAAGKATGRGSVVKSDSRGVDNTGSASVTAVAGPDGEASGAARFASGLLG